MTLIGYVNDVASYEKKAILGNDMSKFIQKRCSRNLVFILAQVHVHTYFCIRFIVTVVVASAYPTVLDLSVCLFTAFVAVTVALSLAIGRRGESLSFPRHRNA